MNLFQNYASWMLVVSHDLNFGMFLLCFPLVFFCTSVVAYSSILNCPASSYPLEMLLSKTVV